MASKKEQNRILIVEDSLFDQKVLEEILSESYQLQKAETANNIFSLVETFAPHLILLDILLPDANGFEVLRSLKEHPATQSIPVVIISGLDGEADEEKGFLLGAVDYIKKPFRNAIVKARINTQIQIINQMRAIEAVSYIDSMTGIFNRRAFDSKLAYEWGRAIRDGRGISMLMIDVDRFKDYNDTYGHVQGDVLLQAVVLTIKSSLSRAVDILCRYGGEEFVVLLPGVDQLGAVVVAEKIRKNIAAMQIPLPQGEMGTPSTHINTTVSVGVVTRYPTQGQPAQSLVQGADKMLYQAKKSGRNRVQWEEASQGD